MVGGGERRGCDLYRSGVRRGGVVGLLVGGRGTVWLGEGEGGGGRSGI